MNCKLRLLKYYYNVRIWVSKVKKETSYEVSLYLRYTMILGNSLYLIDGNIHNQTCLRHHLQRSI